MKKTILITGASSGIGKATAKLFHDKGWNVVATMRRPEKETELNQLDDALVTRLDVADEASIASAIQATLERFGRIDVLLNNAGYGVFGPLEATPMKDIREQFEINVIGLLATTKAVLPHFRKNHEGTVINVSSAAGKVATPLGSLYEGTKFAVEGISEALSYELAEIGVKIKIVEPGAIKTDFKFVLTNDERIGEYQGLARATENFEKFVAKNGSDPMTVAEVIYAAATDGTDRLRYIAGKDAEDLIEKRRTEDDATFKAEIRSWYTGLGGAA